MQWNERTALIAEEAVLGALLLDSTLWDEIEITPGDAYSVHVQNALTAVHDLHRKGETADVLTVSAALERRGLKPPKATWLAILGEAARNSTTTSIASYANALRADSAFRQARAICGKLTERAEDGLEAIDDTVADLMRITDQANRHQSVHIREVLGATIDTLDERARSGTLPGVSTGLKKLDGFIGGLRPRMLYVLAGRPAMGKTTSLCHLALVAAGNGCPVGIFSAEQGREELAQWMISSLGGVDAYRMVMGKLRDQEWKKITDAAAVLAKMPIYINDQPAPHYRAIQRQARRWKRDHGISVLGVDYLQRVYGDRDSKRHEQVEEISRRMKEIARELGIATVLLSQVNRRCEERQNKRPMLSDLRDSGAIEQEADAVITLYRDEVYNPTSEWLGMIELSVLKQRHGPVGTCRVWWDGRCHRLCNESHERSGE